MMKGERLSDLRKDIGLTQQQMAKKLHINYRTYSSYEREEAEACDDIKIKLAEFHNVTVDYLLGISEYPRPLDEKHGHCYLRVPKFLSADGRKEAERYIRYLLYTESIDAAINRQDDVRSK